MRFMKILQSLPFWPQPRPDYYTHGFLDGKTAASDQPANPPLDHAQLKAQAAAAAAATLAADVARDDRRIYQIGWIEGYHNASQRKTPLAG